MLRFAGCHLEALRSFTALLVTVLRHAQSFSQVLRPFLSVLVSVTVLNAQTGMVKFGGQPIPGATVIATQGDHRTLTTTDESGRYDFPDLAPGAYTVEVQMFGFENARRQLQIGPGSPPVEWTLELQPPPKAVAERAQPRQQGFRNVTANELDQLEAPPPSPESGAGTGNANEAFLVNGTISNGLQNAQNDFGIRGPFPGGPGAFGGPGLTAQQPGQPGQTGPGGGVFGGGAPGGGPGGFGGGGRGGGFGGRGGPGRGGRGNGGFLGNRANRGREGIRGNVSFIWHGDETDAKAFSLSGQAVPEPSFNNYRWSGVLGGPLRIPHLLKGDSTFFTVSYYGTRGQSPFYNVGTVPTPLERAGNFSQSYVNGVVPTIYDPLTGAPFPGNMIPSSRFNTAAMGLLNLDYIPSPNLPGTTQNYQFVTAVPADSDNASIRLNQNIGKNDRLALTESFQRRKNETAQLFGFLDPGSGFGDSTDLSWVHNVGVNGINTTHLTFNRNRTTQDSYFSYGADVASVLHIAGTSQEPINYGPPNLSFTNFASLSDSAPSLAVVQSLTESEAFSLAKHNHTMTFGGDFKRLDRNTTTDQNARGSFAFSGIETSQIVNAQPVAGTGFDFADFLLGLPQSSTVQFGGASTYFRQNVWDGFANDDWRVNPKLTIMYGLRYEYYSPLSEKYGHIANLDIAPDFTAVASVLPAQIGPYSGSFPSGLIDPDRHDWAPRGGIAWKPFTKHSTVVRIGYGIYYNPTALNQLATELSEQPPFAATQTLTTSAANILTINNGLATAPTSATIKNTYAVEKDYQIGYAQSWNVTVQQNLTRSLFVELGYLGTKGTDLDTDTVPNRALPGSPLTSQERLQIGDAQQFIYDSSWGNSIYHAAQVRLFRRFARNISFNALYTFSKSIDDSSTFGGVGNVVAQNAFDLSAERGLSSFNRSHVLNLNYVFSTPTQASWWRRNWTLSGSGLIESGTPLTARVLGNQSNAGGTGVVGSGRADATGLPVGGVDGEFFNLAAFTLPPEGSLGDAGRNTIPGPWTWTLNSAFGRYFTIGGEGSRKRIELRLETNNTLNHVNITNLYTVVGATTYGLPYTAGAMRVVDINIRFRF